MNKTNSDWSLCRIIRIELQTSRPGLGMHVCLPSQDQQSSPKGCHFGLLKNFQAFKTILGNFREL